MKFLKGVANFFKEREPTEQEMAEARARIAKRAENGPEIKTVRVVGNRQMRKAIEQHTALGYEVLDMNQNLLYGTNMGRTVTFIRR